MENTKIWKSSLVPGVEIENSLISSDQVKNRPNRNTRRGARRTQQPKGISDTSLDKKLEKGISDLDSLDTQKRIIGAPQQATRSFNNMDMIGVQPVKGIEGVYKNTFVDQSKYGKAIYSDPSKGASMSGFNAGAPVMGQQELAANMLNNPSGTLSGGGLTDAENEHFNKYGNFNQFSLENQAMIPQQQGPTFNFGDDQPGGTFGGDDNWFNRNRGSGLMAKAQSMFSKMPYGKPGDRVKRQSMMRGIEALMKADAEQGRQGINSQRNALEAQSLGQQQQQYQQNFNQNEQSAERQYGIDLYNAMNPEPKAGLFKVLPGTEERYVTDQQGNEVLVPGTQATLFNSADGTMVDNSAQRKRQLQAAQPVQQSANQQLMAQRIALRDEYIKNPTPENEKIFIEKLNQLGK